MHLDIDLCLIIQQAAHWPLHPPGMFTLPCHTFLYLGGADFGLAQAVEEGHILGPRLLFTGHALSQVGAQCQVLGRVPCHSITLLLSSVRG